MQDDLLDPLEGMTEDDMRLYGFRMTDDYFTIRPILSILPDHDQNCYICRLARQDGEIIGEEDD